MRLSSWVLFYILLFTVSAAMTAERWTVSLKDWPADMSAKIRQTAPEFFNSEHDLNSLNQLLKKLDRSFNFSRLQLVRLPQNSKEVFLVGEIAPQVSQINFNNLTDIGESEALNLMGLNETNLLDEQALKSGVEKLVQFYRELGFRSAQVDYQIVTESTISRIITFTVNKKNKTLLTDISLEGIEPAAVRERIEISLRRSYRRSALNQQNLNRISNTLRQLLSTNGYYLVAVPPPQISFTASELTARLSFKMKPATRYSIEVTGTKRFEHTNLEDDVLKLGSYESKDENIISDLSEKLKVFYTEAGYPHATVTPYETRRNERVDLDLNVNEGPYTRIAELKITGQLSRPEQYYRDKFYELASPRIKSKVYIKDDIEIAAKNLLIFLQNDGFINAKASRVYVSTEREKPERGLVVIQIEEGPQVQLVQLQLSGVASENREAVLRAAKLTPGESLSLIRLDAALNEIRNYYQSAGYIEFKILNDNSDLMRYYENNSKVDIEIIVQEGPKVQIQSIVTEGNTRTQDKVILIELDFKPGDVLTPAKISESVSRLQRTGLFNSVEITTLEKDSDVSQRTVIVKVSERDPGVRVLGVGLTDENRGTLHGYTGVAYRNFFGGGVGLSARAELNYNFAVLRYLEQKYTFGFVWPYLFDSRARFRTSATRSNTIGDVSINKVTEANTAVFSLEQDFTSYFTGLLAYSVSTFKDHGITNDDELKYGYSSESLVIGSLGPTLDLDFRDNLFNPTKGSFSRLSLEYAASSLGNNNVDDFYRITGQTTHYLPYRDTGVIFVQSLRGGYIADIDPIKNEGIPFDKRGFTLGGRTTIRGFESAEFFPSTKELGATYRLKTSSSYELVKSELRFPVSLKYDLSGAVFYDGGQVRIDGTTLLNSWRDAVGFGIRYNTPVGPLNLEYGHKLNKKSGESDGAFHLSVGIF